jgi:hypothetical protein
VSVAASGLAAKLSRLFDTVRGPGGRRYTSSEVVDAINAAGQAKMSPSYLSELLSGKKDNPSIWTVKALADFFGQPIDYFTEPAYEPRVAPGSQPMRSDGMATLSERLNLLFAMRQPQPSTAEVAAAIQAAGISLAVEQLAAVRSGDDAELPPASLSAIANFFAIPVAVLTDPDVAAMLATRLPALQLMDNGAVRRIAMRAHGLSEEDKEMVAVFLDRLAREDPGIPPDELTF